MSNAAAAAAAAVEYLDRKSRVTHPDGSFDKAGRWEMDDSERCECCAGIRTPSRAYPFSEMQHCRTKKHVASLYGVTVSEINKVIKNLEV